MGPSLSLRARGSAFPHVPGSPGGACPQAGESGKGTGVDVGVDFSGFKISKADAPDDDDDEAKEAPKEKK